jgi:hypothetical protein
VRRSSRYVFLTIAWSVLRQIKLLAGPAENDLVTISRSSNARQVEIEYHKPRLVLCQAIAARRLITFSYDHGPRGGTRDSWVQHRGQRAAQRLPA